MKLELRPRLFSAVVLICCGCTTPHRPVVDLMPFHVAIAPLTDVELRTTANKEKGAADMSLVMDGLVFSEELRKALGDRSFVKVTLLDLPSEDDASITQEGWERKARQEHDADLLITCRLWYGSEIQQGLNAWAFGSFLVFSIGGPFCWFFPDRTYSSEAGVVVSAVDLSSPELFGELVSDRALPLECFEHTEILQEEKLSFIDRAGTTYWYYALSIIIPSLFLARDHSGLEQDYPVLVAEALAVDVAEGLFKRRPEILRNETRYDFYLGREDLLLKLGEGGALSFEWTLFHSQQPRTSEPSEYRIQVGEFDKTFQVADSQLDDNRPSLPGTPTGYRSYRFNEAIPFDGSADLVRLVVRTFGDRPQIRSYSIPIPEDLRGLPE
ncbi:MAG: hypothetical protein ACI8X5_002796 [Planctomycetota bacterium]|jgi:hypothetical protein